MNEDDGQPRAAAPLQQARRRLLIIVLALVGALLLLSSSDVSNKIEDEDPSTPANDGPDDPDLPTAELRRVAAQIADMAAGPIYPAHVNATNKFAGSWVADGFSDMKSIKAALTPNISTQFVVIGGLSAPSTLGFGNQKGGMRMQLLTIPSNAKVPTLQRTEGVMVLFDGDSETDDSTTRIDLPVTGVYVADEGLLLLAATRKLAAVQLMPAHAPSARALQFSGNDSSAIGSNSCDMFMALRFRPIGGVANEATAYAENGHGAEDGEGRQLGSAPVFEHYSGARFLVLSGRIVSPNCNFSINTTIAAAVVDQDALADKEMSYALLATCSSVALMMLVTFQIVRSGSQSAASRISVLTLGLQALMDAYMTLFHMIAGMLQPILFGSFATTSFVQLMLFSVLEMRFMLIIWKARRQDAFNSGWDAVRREIGSLYMKFYLVLLLGLAIIYFGSVGGIKFVTLICFSFWLPQIIHSAQHDSRPGLANAYVIGTSICRLLIPLYFFACPANLLYTVIPPETRAAALQQTTVLGLSLLQPWKSPSIAGSAAAHDTYPALASPEAAAAYWVNVKFAIFLTAWVFLQCIVLLLQSKVGWGPRFFVPAVFLPQKYSYHRAISLAGDRVAPDPVATQSWLRDRAPESPVEVPNNAPTDEGSSWLTRTTSSARRSVSRYATQAVNTSVWFLAGLRLFGSDVATRAQARWRSAMSRAPSRRQYQPIDTTNSASAASAPGEGSADIEAGGAQGAAEELDQMVPIDLTGTAHVDCVICMESINFPCRRRDYMVTPCDHIFHTHCLRPWMEQKLECPTCRLQLPEP